MANTDATVATNLLAGLVAMANGQFGTNGGGQTINVNTGGPRVPMAREGGYGSPDDIPFVEGELTEIEAMGSPEADEYELEDMTSEFDQFDFSAPYGMPDSYGGIWDRFTGAVKSATGKTSSIVKRLTTKVNKLVQSSNRHKGQIRKNHKDIEQVKRRANAAYYMSKRSAKVINEEFGEETQYVRAALSAAQAIPGIRALNLFESEQFDDLIKFLISQTDNVEDLKVKTSDTDYSLDALSGAPNWDELAARDDELLGAVNELRADMQALIIALKDGGDNKATLEAFAEAKEATMLTSLAKILPSQIRRKQEAVVQGIAKHVLGSVGNGGDLFNFSLSA